jgi:hypothetical protein
MKLRSLTATLLAILTILTVLTCIKIIISSDREYHLAEEQLAQNKISTAINHYERALHWYLPFSQTPYAAAEKLWEITQNQQTQNQKEEALKTYRILRAAFYSIRSIYTPGKKWIHRCNEKISHIMATRFIDSQKMSKITFSEKKSQYMILLETERRPFIFASIVNEIGFFGWIASVLFFIFKALSPQGNIKKGPAILFFSTFLFFYSIWVWGLFNA